MGGARNFLTYADSRKVAFENQLQTQYGRIGFTHVPYRAHTATTRTEAA